MKSFSYIDVNHMYANVIPYILSCGVEQDSRNGKVLVVPHPVSMHYLNPTHRVLFDASRDANPFFHLLESIWMLAGRNDAAWVSEYNQQMKEYADSDGTFHGAYGYRWRYHFAKDQIEFVARMLRKDPTTRRAVIAMWDAAWDLDDGPDMPCNTHIYFSIRNGKLDMMVCNRSNDAVWGALGANAVHLTMLHELIAVWVGVPVGHYWQVTNNLHIYTEIPKVWAAVNDPQPNFAYHTRKVTPMPLCNDAAGFLGECEAFCEGGMGNDCNFIVNVAHPMRVAWKLHKMGATNEAIELCNSIQASDWRLACQLWLKRRMKNVGSD